MTEELQRYRRKKICKRCPNCRVNIEKNDGCDHMTCTHCGYEFCWFCKREYVVCCNRNPIICLSRGILRHRWWGHDPKLRLTTKIIGVPIVTGLSIGIGATVVGLGIGCGAVLLAGAPLYYGGKYLSDVYL